MKITKIEAQQILDSRGQPTISCALTLSSGDVVEASVPSGASVSAYEAHELRDADAAHFGGKGVLHAVEQINSELGQLFCGKEPDSRAADKTLCELDTTATKEKLGGNTTLALSLVILKAEAVARGQELYQRIAELTRTPKPALPRILANLINGGMHAANGLMVQEYLVVSKNAQQCESAIEQIVATYQELKCALQKRGLGISVGDEGGFSDLPQGMKIHEPLDLLTEVIESLELRDHLALGIDAAASTWFNETDGLYQLDGRTWTAGELVGLYQKLCEEYDLISLEDPCAEDDVAGWNLITQKLGAQEILIGDDLFASHADRISFGIKSGLANAVLIKPNQAGTMSEIYQAIEVARQAGYKIIVSHRSGETLDTSIVDLAVGVAAWGIKCGAPARGERIAKYNRLMELATHLS